MDTIKEIFFRVKDRNLSNWISYIFPILLLLSIACLSFYLDKRKNDKAFKEWIKEHSSSAFGILVFTVLSTFYRGDLISIRSTFIASVLALSSVYVKNIVQHLFGNEHYTPIIGDIVNKTIVNTVSP